MKFVRKDLNGNHYEVTENAVWKLLEKLGLVEFEDGREEEQSL